MLRNALRKLLVSRTFGLWKRPYYSNWHINDMNDKENKYVLYLRDLWHRRQLVGPDEPTPRSSKFLWNYESELFAFGKRLNEEFELSTLRRAFKHATFDEDSNNAEEQGQSTSHSEDTSNNEEFIAAGEKLIDTYVPAYLRYHFPKLPEEGISLISAHLCSDKQLSYLGRNLGMYDLILAANFPYDDVTIARTFKAVVGALKHDSGEKRTEYFVQDFILTELIDMDINEIFYLKNPMRILTAILEKSGRGLPEPRILRQAGSFTVTPVYVVGIYVDGRLFGQAPGESVTIAEQMAARDCLKTLWDTHMERRLPLTFGEKAGRALNLDPYKVRQNDSLRTLVDFQDDADLVSVAFESEPLDLGEMYEKYKEEIEPAFGKVYRRKFEHTYSKGTIFKHCRRPFIAPNVKTI